MEVRLCKREKALVDLGWRDALAHGVICRSVLTLSDVNALRTSHHTLWIPVILDNKALTATRDSTLDSMLDSMLDSTLDSRRPGGSVRGERANFTKLVLGCIEAQCTLLHRFGIQSRKARGEKNLARTTPRKRSLISIILLKII